MSCPCLVHVLSRTSSVIFNSCYLRFQAGYRHGKYKLLWGDHTKGGWYGEEFSRRNHRKLKNKIDWEQIQIKLISDQNIVDLEESDWDLEDDKRVPEDNPNENFEDLGKDQPIMLFDVESDPRETKDISKENESIVNLMLEKLISESKTMRKGNFELKSVLGHPFFHGGNFMPGWCKPEV